VAPRVSVVLRVRRFFRTHVNHTIHAVYILVIIVIFFLSEDLAALAVLLSRPSPSARWQRSASAVPDSCERNVKCRFATAHLEL
jgi:hypothetical protein